MTDATGRGERFPRTANAFHQPVHIQIKHRHRMRQADLKPDLVACDQHFECGPTEGRPFPVRTDITIDTEAAAFPDARAVNGDLFGQQFGKHIIDHRIACGRQQAGGADHSVFVIHRQKIERIERIETVHLPFIDNRHIPLHAVVEHPFA